MKSLLTYDDYALLPEGAPYELIDGFLIKKPSPSTRHQRLSQQLWMPLWKFIRDRNLGEIFHAPLDRHLSPTDTFQPDIIFISNERGHIIGEQKIEGAPDLVIEILSPGTARFDVHEKKGAYETYGVREYWIVDPVLKRIELYVSRDGRFDLVQKETGIGTIYSVIIPGFEMDLKELFAWPP